MDPEFEDEIRQSTDFVPEDRWRDPGRFSREVPTRLGDIGARGRVEGYLPTSPLGVQ